jgi:hypothetical protein
MVGLLSFGIFSVAVPAVARAEPISYNMYCTDLTGDSFYVTKPSQCSWGQIKFISTYDGKVAAKLDMYALQSHMKVNHEGLAKLYKECSGDVICQIGIAAVDTLVLRKVKLAYVWFKAIIG